MKRTRSPISTLIGVAASVLALVTLTMSSTAMAQEKLIKERTLTKQSTWYHKTNVTVDDLAAFISDKDARIIDLDVNSTSPFRVSAAMVKNTGSHASKWWWYPNLTAKQVSDKLDQHKARLLDLDIHRQNGQLRFAVVMIPNTGEQATGWWWYIDQTSEQLSKKLKDNNARLVDIERYRTGNKTRFAAIMVKNTGSKATKWWWYPNITSKQLKDKLAEKNARILDIERFKTSGDTRFAAILVPHGGSTSNRWWYYTGISRDKLVELGRRHGARLVDIEPPAYGAKKYTGLFVDNGMVKTGKCSNKLKSFDKALIKEMKRTNVPGATMAVVKDGRLVHACGYGYSNLGKNKHMKPDTLLRIASIAKPITVAALQKLEADNKLNLEHKVVNNLGTAKPAKPYKDQRVENISIQNLIDHRGGWDRVEGVNPMFMSNTIANALGTSKPTSCKNVIRYMFQKESLDFIPGNKNYQTSEDKDPYSNFGYCLLGRVVEKASHTSYENYVKRNVLKPMGITKMRIGRGLKANRQPNEAQYYDPPFQAKVTPIYPNGPDKVYRPDGQFHLEAMDSHGGWIASAMDIARFATKVDPLPYGRSNWGHNGALSGSWTAFAVKGDVTVVILMNSRSGADLNAVMDKGIAGVQSWPTRNLWADYGYEARRAN